MEDPSKLWEHLQAMARNVTLPSQRQRIKNPKIALRKIKTLYNMVLKAYGKDWLDNHFPVGQARDQLKEALANAEMPDYDANDAVDRGYITYEPSTDQVRFLCKSPGLRAVSNEDYMLRSWDNMAYIFLTSIHRGNVHLPTNKRLIENAWLAQMHLIQELYTPIVIDEVDDNNVDTRGVGDGGVGEGGVGNGGVGNRGVADGE